MAFTRYELKQLDYLHYVGPAGALLRAYIELLVGRAVTDAEYQACLRNEPRKAL